MMRREVVTTYLEMTDPERLRAADPENVELVVVRSEIPCPDLNRFFYLAVGSRYAWHARLAWTSDDWLQYLDRECLETWIGCVRGTPAGYFELEESEAGVELAYFGLLPQFVGHGLGGVLLTRAVERAWAMGTKRVWVHTCDLDHAHALANYTARGFEVYRTETAVVEMPALSLDLWSGVGPALAAQLGAAADEASPL